MLGAKLAKTAGDDTYTEGGTTPGGLPMTWPSIQQQLRILQWATPVLAGALIVLGAQQGEQQRPRRPSPGECSHDHPPWSPSGGRRGRAAPQAGALGGSGTYDYGFRPSTGPDAAQWVRLKAAFRGSKRPRRSSAVPFLDPGGSAVI